MEKTNQPGLLANVNKNILTVAPEYQRQASPSLIKSIKDSWDWIAAGVLIVSKRDNQHFVIDGQHRLRAAQARSDIDKLPCVIFENLTLAEEATRLAIINSQRKNMTAIDKFNARLKGNDATAVYVFNRVSSFKLFINSKGANTISCVNNLMSCAKTNKARLDRVLQIAVRLFKHDHVDTRAFKGLEYLDSKISLADERLQNRILELGKIEIMAGIKAAMYRLDNHHDRTCAMGIMEAVNKNLKNKFEVAF
jgi:hypothetical protein